MNLQRHSGSNTKIIQILLLGEESLLSPPTFEGLGFRPLREEMKFTKMGIEGGVIKSLP